MNYGDVDKNAVRTAMRKAFGATEERPSDRLQDLLRRIAESDKGGGETRRSVN